MAKAIKLDGWEWKNNGFERDGYRVFEWVRTRSSDPVVGLRLPDGKTKYYGSLTAGLRAAIRLIEKANDDGVTF